MQHLQQIEARLGVEVKRRGNRFQIIGMAGRASSARKRVLQDLYTRAQREPVDSERVHIALQELGMDGRADAAGAGCRPAPPMSSKCARRAARSGRAAPNQTEYLNNVRTHDLTFGIGPAGTGKTYLAVACAVEALQSESVRRIVLVRPAVEAGERLGFLPGDLSQKVDPYLRPMYDALYEMMGFERVAKLIERNVIEVAPLAFMRGRSLNDSFVILDEAQNTTNEQMKMFLTRIGFGSKAVVTGRHHPGRSADCQAVRSAHRDRHPARRARHRLHACSPRATWCAIRWCSGSCRPMKRTRPTMARERTRQTLELDVSYAARRPWAPPTCAVRTLGRRRAARPPPGVSVLSIRVVGTARSRSLNARYRRKDKPTNVLSFGGAGPGPEGRNYLGELVICAPVVALRGARAGQVTRVALGAHDGARRAAPARLRPRTARRGPENGRA